MRVDPQTRRKETMRIYHENQAREIIRRHDEALAFKLDALFPIDPCPHSPFEIIDLGPNRKLWQPPKFKCRGCEIPMYRSGPSWALEDRRITVKSLTNTR